MDDSSEKIDIECLISNLRSALDSSNVDSILELNTLVTDAIRSGQLDQKIIADNPTSITELYRLIRESEALVASLKSEIKGQQIGMYKKRKLSRKYLDVGKL